LVPFNRDTELFAVRRLVLDDTQHEPSQAVIAALPGERIATTQPAVGVDAGREDGTTHQPAGLVDQVDVTDGGVQHGHTHMRGELLHTISQQWPVVPLILFYTFTGDVIVLQTLVLAVEIPELVEGGVFGQQVPALITIPFFQHQGVRRPQAVSVLRIVELVQRPADVLGCSGKCNTISASPGCENNLVLIHQIQAQIIPHGVFADTQLLCRQGNHSAALPFI